MQICFIKDGTALTLPVTPAGYAWGVGRNLETINISSWETSTAPADAAGFPAKRWNVCCPLRTTPGWSREQLRTPSIMWTF